MSYLTTSLEGLKTGVIAALEGEGFAYNPLTTSFPRYLATALGEPNAYLTKSVAQMLSEIDAQYGGILSHLRASIAQLLDDVTANIGGGGGGGYIAKAVHFDGAARLVNDALSCTDTSFVLFSIWFKVAEDAISAGFLASDPDGEANNVFYFRGTTGGIGVELGDNPFTNHIEPKSTGATMGAWHNFIFGADTNHVADSRLWKFYTDDVDTSDLTENGAGLAFAAGFNGFKTYSGSDGDNFTGDIADFQMYLLGSTPLVAGDIPQATRRLFNDGSGKPVEPATAVAALGNPVILFSGDATGFATNQGTGGAFTLTGALTNASTSPSD